MNAVLTKSQATEQDPRWQAVLNRDSAFDGEFYYSVKTTGVYCKPSCAARPAKPEHVGFHLKREDAERAGFRPCKRGKPDQPPMAEQYAAKIAGICRLIGSQDEIATLDELARAADMSPYYFHRIFKSITGVTPKAYADAANEHSISETIYEAGFNSSGRFYETTNQMLGMRPKDYRAGGANMVIHFAVGECSLGSILVAKSERGVCAILLGDDPDAHVRDLQDRFPRADLVGGDEGFERLVAKVVGYVEAPGKGLDLPLDIRGTAFQQRVWNALREIPSGSTASYSDIANRIGAPKSVRAVAQACAANSIAVAIPCHRVVMTDGSLSGYRWGIGRKRALLDNESAA
ncbi:MAG: bifunctional DNA-binding transcriptional regulator/O6-methylguanine-DNA methyltransferase Ada [Fimbriimonadales bacterium]